jgi:thiol-disulfide isomerase/thioredoxin
VRTLVVAALLLAGAAARADLLIGEHAKPLDLPDLEGNVLTTQALAGKVAVVDFFATWCGPCHEAMAALDAIVRAEPRVQLVVVDVGEDPEVVRAFFQKRPLPPGTRVVLDRRAEASHAWGQKRFPTTFILDGSGFVRHINRGYGPGYAARMQRWLRTTLAP